MRSNPLAEPAGGTGAEATRAADLLFRRRGAQLTATLTRVLGIEHLDLVEDVVQEAFLRALRLWPTAGVPEHPAAWILTVAKHGALDVLRRQGRWQDKRAELERAILPTPTDAAAPRVYFGGEISDDELRLIFATCHPSLSHDAQVTLTLKTVCGFGTGEIARAFFTSPTTIAQRLVRAKRTLREAHVTLDIPQGDGLPPRRDAVLEVLYLLFNEGYRATAGDALVRADLCAEGIRLTELMAGHPVVGGPGVHALAALFLFQAARLPARTDPGGTLIPLEDQDRSRWDRRVIRRALEHQVRSASGEELTPYHLQAEIASCHTLAPSFAETDWARIVGCYDQLMAIAGTPVIALHRVVATAQVEGPISGLQALASLREEPSLQSDHRLHAVEAELLWRAGRNRDATEAVDRAISQAPSAPVRRYLERRRAAYHGPEHGGPEAPMAE